MNNLLKRDNKKHFITVVLLLLFLIIFILIIFFKFSNVCSKLDFVNINLENSSISTEMEKDDSWYISIPKINLVKVNIEESTSDEILSKSIGHFEDTDIFNGNVCLAAHNRGNKVNYFERIHELKPGDEIYYNCKDGHKIYEVEYSIEIDVYDFSCTKNETANNVITLITCVENNPNKRLCIRGIERSI